MARLVRFREFNATELTSGLYRATTLSREELITRYSPGTVRRLGTSRSIAAETVKRALAQDRNDDIAWNGNATFAVLDGDETSLDGAYIIGAATIIRNLKLYIQRFPVRPRWTDRIPTPFARIEALYGNANITGWVMPSRTEQLTDVYRHLLSETPEGNRVWTIEPMRASPEVHEALVLAGMRAIGEPERFDVGEDRYVLIPISQAYV